MAKAKEQGSKTYIIDGQELMLTSKEAKKYADQVILQDSRNGFRMSDEQKAQLFLSLVKSDMNLQEAAKVHKKEQELIYGETTGHLSKHKTLVQLRNERDRETQAKYQMAQAESRRQDIERTGNNLRSAQAERNRTKTRWAGKDVLESQTPTKGFEKAVNFFRSALELGQSIQRSISPSNSRSTMSVNISNGKVIERTSIPQNFDPVSGTVTAWSALVEEVDINSPRYNELVSRQSSEEIISAAQNGVRGDPNHNDW